MSNFIFSVNATIPLFLIIALGFFLRKIKMFNESFLSVADKFVFKVALPLMLFKDISSMDLRQEFDIKFILFCMLATTAMFLIPWVLSVIFMKDKIIKWFYILFPIILGSIVGLIVNDYSYYSTINKSILAPPKILFPIMWSIIYLLMGISYKTYRDDNDSSILYYVQLFVNVIWVIIFFKFKLLLLSLLWIILLDILIIILLIEFYKKNKLCCYLNIPYLIWNLFATYLMISIYILN